MPALITHTRRALIFASIALLGACSPLDSEFSELTEALFQSSAGPRFEDKDPQEFGMREPSTYPVHGIDVSKWQGDIDWAKVRASNVDFAFLKATEGGDRFDDRFLEYWRQSRAAGIPRGAYHFYYFCRPAIEQARWFIKHVPREKGALPPVLDMEWNHLSPSCKLRPEPKIVRREMQIFLDAVTRHYGVKPIIYTTIDFHRENLEGHFESYPFWVRAVAKHPDELYEKRRWAFWQYTATGMVPGIETEADINVFIGDREGWQDLLKTATQG